MAELILPRRFKGQPQYPAPIDKSGIGAKAKFALLGGQASELISGIARAGAIGTNEAAPDGIAYVPSNVATTWAKQIDSVDPYLGASFTVNWRGIIRANTSQTLLRYIGDTYGWSFLTSAWAPGQIVFSLNANFWGNTTSSGAINVTDGTLHNVTLICDANAATIQVYFDAVSVFGPTSWAIDRGPVGANGKFGVVGDATAPHKMLGVEAYAGMLTAPEIAKRYSEPWGVLKAPARRLWAVASSGINLVGATSTQANSASTAGITQTHVLVGTNSAQANSASAPTITQTHILAGANSTQANAASTGSIAGGVNLTIAPSTQANASSTGAITQTHALIMAPSVQDNIAAASAIVQAHILAGANSTQGNLGGTGAISLSTGNLIGAPSAQSNIGGTGFITQIGPIPDAFLSSMAVSTAIGKPGVPTGTPDWLKTIIETVLGRRGNKITVPAEQTLTFSATPTQAECQALYQYTNSVRSALADLINRLDS